MQNDKNDKDNKQLSWSNPQQGAQPKTGQQPQPPHSQPQAAAPKPAASAGALATSAASSAKAAKVAGWLAVGVVAGVVIAWGATSALNRGSSSQGLTTAGGNESASSTPAAATSSLMTVASPQKAGSEVSVSGIKVSGPTWVVVYESRNGTPGNVLGAALFFPGTSSGTVELLRGTATGQTYFVTERKDNGDHRFSLTDDAYVLGADGEPSWTTFVAN